MSQITMCDICHEFLKPGESKCLLSWNVVPDNKKEIKDEEYKDMLQSVFNEMSQPNRTIPLYEICGKCLEVLYHFINIRKDELDRVKKEINKIVVKKTKITKEIK